MPLHNGEPFIFRVLLNLNVFSDAEKKVKNPEGDSTSMQEDLTSAEPLKRSSVSERDEVDKEKVNYKN